jgi:hypothetical protein
VAVVIGNRLPPAGDQAVAHLVSVEGRYRPDGFDLGPGGPDSLVRLVSLASWRFACLDADQNFASLVRDLAQDASPYRLPGTGAAAADAFLEQGFVAVRHQLRNGGATVSWYRGPFATGPVTGPPPPAALTADQLVRFLPGTGMFDVSYAAAWTLGRLLALQSTDYATALYDWKRRRNQKLLRAKLEPDRGYPLAVPEIDDDLPDTVRSFLAGLARLDGVPAAYLIPDERLLPPESIRFLQVDARWVQHLLDGAFSVGRLTAADATLDGAHRGDGASAAVTAALIRSDVVAGYPGLVIDGYSAADKPMTAHSRQLSPNILLCLFDRVLARLDIRQRPESLHFAVELPTDGMFTKTLRDAAGASGPVLDPLPLGPGGRLPVEDLAAHMATALGATAFGSGDFARQMIETAELVSFLSI